MVLWCKGCGALIGLRPPVSDWTIDRDCFCTICVESQSPTLAKKMEVIVENDQELIGNEKKLIPS